MAGYFVIGIVFACLYALSASGLVVTYTTSGIFNFGHGAIGMFCAFVYWHLAVMWHWPWPLAMAFVLFVFAPVLGAVIERVAIRPLYGASLGVTLVVTLGLLLGFLALAQRFWKPTITRHLPTIFPGSHKVFGVAVTNYELMVFVVSVAVAIVLRLLFSRTRAGITMRAVVDDRDLTARSGASPARTAQLSWAIGASLAALAGILIAGGNIQQLDQVNLTLLVITGYAAAIVGRMKNLPLTVVGAVILGMATSYATGYLPNNLLSNLTPVIPVGLLFLALLVFPQDRLRTARLGAAKVRRVTTLRLSVLAAAAFVAASMVAAQILSPGNLITMGTGMALGIVMLSLVLLTGYGGQVSLCQLTFAGLGAFCMGKIAGGSSAFGLIAAALLPAAVGGLLAVVILRLRSLYLALATLAFAYGMDNMFFQRQLGYGGILNVGRFGFHSQKAYLLEMVILFAALAVGVLSLRRGPFGRQLAAMRDSELACTSMGMSVTFTKVIAFTIAAGIAGLGGAAYGGWQQQVGPNDFAMLKSLILLLLIALGGIATVGGAFAAATFYALNPIIQRHIGLDPNLLIGLGAVGLGRNQGGAAGLFADAVDRVRIWRAIRGRAPTRISEGEEGQLVSIAG